MKNILLFFGFLFSVHSFSYGQSKYLNMSRKQIVKILNSEGIEIMEQDTYMIHSVDDKSLCNLIFYFDSDNVCYHMKTIYQEEKDFFKLTNYYEMRYGTDNGLKWAIPIKNGVDSIKALRECGFDLIEETYYR